MEHAIVPTIPRQALQRLEFLIGESTGIQTIYPPGGRARRYEAACSVRREACDRFVQIDLFTVLPERDVESLTAFLTYSTKKECYEMWVFSSTTEEPLHMTGDFQDGDLVLISDPWPMAWGLQRLRTSFTPHDDGSIEFRTELWEPDGYAKFRCALFQKHVQAC